VITSDTNLVCRAGAPDPLIIEALDLARAGRSLSHGFRIGGLQFIDKPVKIADPSLRPESRD
jgi:hypothetical protein